MRGASSPWHPSPVSAGGERYRAFRILTGGDTPQVPSTRQEMPSLPRSPLYRGIRAARLHCLPIKPCSGSIWFIRGVSAKRPYSNRRSCHRSAVPSVGDGRQGTVRFVWRAALRECSNCRRCHVGGSFGLPGTLPPRQCSNLPGLLRDCTHAYVIRLGFSRFAEPDSDFRSRSSSSQNA